MVVDPAVVLRRFAGMPPELYWPAAEAALAKLQDLVAKATKKPTEPNIRKALNFAYKNYDISIWVGKCLTEDEDEKFLVQRRALSQVMKNKSAPLETLQEMLERYVASVRIALQSAAPANFVYSGFQISNPERFGDRLARQVLDGLDYLRALFKKRGVVKFIDQDIARVVLTSDTRSGEAYFHAGTRELMISVPRLLKEQSARVLEGVGRVGETLLHEFGHYIHRVYIKGEAEAAWNAPWKGVPSLANPHEIQLPEPKRRERLDPLEIPTDYGKTDMYEDFAETFMLFMAEPQKLSTTARFRMQQALSLSGLYGKSVMRLAQQVVAGASGSECRTSFYGQGSVEARRGPGQKEPRRP